MFSINNIFKQLWTYQPILRNEQYTTSIQNLCSISFFNNTFYQFFNNNTILSSNSRWLSYPGSSLQLDPLHYGFDIYQDHLQSQFNSISGYFSYFSICTSVVNCSNNLVWQFNCTAFWKHFFFNSQWDSIYLIYSLNEVRYSRSSPSHIGDGLPTLIPPFNGILKLPFWIHC